MLSNLSLKPHLQGPLYRQVYETLRLGIVDGTLKSNQRLPSSRELSTQLGVSRNTVNSAYDMLQAEGYIESRPGSGFYINEFEALYQVQPQARSQNIANTIQLSSRGLKLAENSRPVPSSYSPAFQCGSPDLNEFPIAKWQRCLNTATTNMLPDLMGYQDQGGIPQLKQSLCDYLRMSRGAHCEPEQIVIVNGSQAGLDLIARMCINPGDFIAIENPGYLGAKDGFLAADANLLPIEVDTQGLRVEALAQFSKQYPVPLVYVTPSYQFPSGHIMSASRRLQLLQWASENDAFIVEDDYDSEFRYKGQPLSCLQGLDQQQRVIYLGTFSKVMFPGLRLGYLALPKQLAKPFALALRKTGQDPSLLLQAAMAEFIRSGFFASHIRKMRKLYGKKQTQLVELIKQHLGDVFNAEPTAAGMQIACYYKIDIDENKLAKLADQQGLVLTSLSRYYSKNSSQAARHGLYLGYASVALEELEPSVIKLKKLIQQCRK